MVDLLSGVEYVGCTRSQRLQDGTARAFYRVTLTPSLMGYMLIYKFTDALRQVVANVQAKSGDAIAPTDPAPASLDDETRNLFSTATLDFMTLGAARSLAVSDMVTAIEASAGVSVQRVERVDESQVRGPDRFTARDGVSTAAAPKNPLSAAFGGFEKLTVAIAVLALLVGAAYFLPRR